MEGRPSERGLALVVVLWGVAALSLIAAAMAAAAISAAHVEHNAWTQLQVQTAADAGIQGAVLSLFDPDASNRSPLDGRERQISVLGTAVTVSIQDEAGRIDLNSAGRNLLRDYFKAAGASDADGLADRVVARRSGAATENPQAAKPFQSVDELNFIPGMTPGLLSRVAPGLTVYSHSPNFDMRVAPDGVLQVIPGVDQHGADVMIAGRHPGTAPIGHAFTVVADAQHGPARFSRRAVILLSGDPARPYWMLDWK